jgi:hypothetical protein
MKSSMSLVFAWTGDGQLGSDRFGFGWAGTRNISATEASAVLAIDRLYTMLVEWNVSPWPLGLPTSLFRLYAERFEVVVEFGL